MLLAKRYPTSTRGRGNVDPAKESDSVSFTRIKQARTVLHKCPQFVDLVIDGSMGLDAAYEQAHRKDVADSIEAERTAQRKMQAKTEDTGSTTNSGTTGDAKRKGHQTGERARVSQARAVHDYCKEMIAGVIDGSIALNDAYSEAHQLNFEPMFEVSSRAVRRCASLSR